MRQFAFIALLIVAGCAETPVRSAPSGQQTGTATASLDCDAAIDKGIKRLAAGLQEYAPDPQTLENGIRTFDRIKGALVRRCVVDSWPPEVTQCFATMERRTDMQTCQTGTSARSGSRGSDQSNRYRAAGGGSTAKRSRRSPRCSLRRLSRSHASRSASVTSGSRVFS